MSRKTFAVAAACLAAVAAAPAADAAARPETRLVLSVTGSDEAPSAALLTCSPAGGTHHFPEAACGAIALVHGDFTALAFDVDRPCTLQFDPVRVSARGHWRGEAVAFERSYGNRCEMQSATGPVFLL